MRRKETARQRHIRVTLYDRLTDAMARRGVYDGSAEGNRLRSAWFEWVKKGC